MVNLEAIINVKLIPRSSRNEIIGKENDGIKIKLTAPPVDGRANKALVQFLANKLGVPKQDIEIVSGERSRKKSIRINGISTEKVKGILIG
jgi:uncharacterized protein (TIGR00251 family)